MWLHDCEKILKIHYVIRFDRICLHIGYVTDGHSDTARRIPRLCIASRRKKNRPSRTTDEQIHTLEKETPEGKKIACGRVGIRDVVNGFRRSVVLVATL